ncbi:MAG TPA: S8 family serine peptidase [Dyella sp.]|uniref:S8 family peptidase n=1 Tax=Dyella sp. TaxID=1869338 RepID=UPI002F922D00
MPRACLFALLSLFLATAGWALPRPPQAKSEPSAQPAQVLVMLRAPAPHFQPAGAYGGAGYRGAPGEAGRRRVAQQLAREHGLVLIDDWPMPSLGVDCFVMRAAGGVSTAQLAADLAKDARVESAQPMQMFHALGRAGHGDPLYTLQLAAARWHLAELHEVATGKGVVIAVIDSGVDAVHPELRGQVTMTRNFVDGDRYRAEMHGTAVAGIVAANGLGIAGIAPEARVLALRACWERQDAATECNSFTLAKALQFALEQHVDVLNLSLAGPRDQLLERLLGVAMAHRMAVVGAVDPSDAANGFPAACPGVIAVVGDRTGLVPHGALVAPERDIPAPVPGGGFELVNGTSFATAQVSGLVALMLETSPRLDDTRLQTAMMPQTAVGLSVQRPAMIDACMAVARTSGRCACDCDAASLTSSVPR